MQLNQGHTWRQQASCLSKMSVAVNTRRWWLLPELAQERQLALVNSHADLRYQCLFWRNLLQGPSTQWIQVQAAETTKCPALGPPTLGSRWGAAGHWPMLWPQKGMVGGLRTTEVVGKCQVPSNRAQQPSNTGRVQYGVLTLPLSWMLRLVARQPCPG